MNKENTEKLYEKYPTIFMHKDLPVTQSLMCFGFDFDDGWFKLMDELCEKLELIEKTTGIKVVAQQCKEKFAGLRVYVHMEFPTDTKSVEIWQDIIYGILNGAENKSFQTCEKCGEYGRVRVSRGWHKTLCDTHAKELEYID